MVRNIICLKNFAVVLCIFHCNIVLFLRCYLLFHVPLFPSTFLISTLFIFSFSCYFSLLSRIFTNFPTFCSFSIFFRPLNRRNSSPRCDIHRPHVSIIANGLQYHPSRSRSVPENLAHVSAQHSSDCQCSGNANNMNRTHWRSSSFRHPNRQVVEQITTSV